jgi:acylglycerol lipase
MESQEEQTGGTFVGAGGIELFFRSWPAPAPRGVVVLSHGLGEHSGRYHHVGRRLADAGYSTWALDHRGHGRSGGRRAFVEAFSSFVADLETFRLRVAAASGGLPTFLLGHSMGGTIATAHALDHPGAFAGLVLSAPAWHPGRDVPRPVVAVGRALARIRLTWAWWPSTPPR